MGEYFRVLLGLALIGLLGLSNSACAQYIYEDNQSLIDLTNQSGTTNLNSGDDQLSSAFNLDFTFDFYGESFTSARMATNGCLHFGLGTGNVSYENYCGDYTPDPLPQYNYTLFPFWTDLIRDTNSQMLAKNFSDKAVFGWYDMREYNRASDNSFEVILWTNDTFEYRYGELDIIQHDVLIGEQGKSDEIYTYYYHDECNTGTTNTSSCYNYDWNNSDKNQNLEDGGSLYSNNNSIDCSNPLNDTSCAGYADAYQTQQCDIDQLYSESCPSYAAAYLSQQCDITQLYSESCPFYWEAYDDLQCSLDPQYGPFCQGYRQEESVAYFVEEEVFDYGYEEYDMYDTFEEPELFEEPEILEEYIFELEYDTFEEPEFVFEEEIIFEQFQPREEFVEPFEVLPELPMHEEEIFMPMEDVIFEEFVFQENLLVEEYLEPETFIEFETIEELEEWFEEETAMEEELTSAEEQEEELVDEIVEEEKIIEEAIEEEELVAESTEGKSSISREMALNVVSSTLSTAQASVSGTTAGTSVHATGGTTGASSVSSSSSGGGVSISNSPSISEQFTSSTVQNNQVLAMSTSFNTSNSTSSTSSVSSTSSTSSISSTSSTSSTTSTNVETQTVETTSVAVNTTPTQTLQSQIDVSVSTDASATETEQTVANVIAQNLQAAQDDVEAKQEETGEYGSENTIIAYMGFVPNFNNYRLVTLPDQDTWYESTDIYANNMLSDNIEGFYQMAGQNLETLIKMRELQPPL